MSLQEFFDKAIEDIKKLKTTPSDKDLLELYGLFKQSTIGDCNTEKPGFLDFKGKSKWDAWNGRKGTSQDAAMQAYVDKVNHLIEQHGLQ
ncbi:acyl-CoA-binding protein homolog [Anopheles nili]|uniref:acyl-CoA-binding protein homolog n=1 Tax=Anopheles nili TaxID=185578 RepID=UPI00237AF609|nr:acyl-CoA-binding protein homolog [Anopheles nili]